MIRSVTPYRQFNPRIAVGRNRFQRTATNFLVHYYNSLMSALNDPMVLITLLITVFIIVSHQTDKSTSFITKLTKN